MGSEGVKVAMRVETTCDYGPDGASPCGDLATLTLSAVVGKTEWVMDLCASHGVWLEQNLARAGALAKAPRAEDHQGHVSASGTRFSARDARAWLREHGHPVSDAGRLPAPLLAIYAANN